MAVQVNRTLSPPYKTVKFVFLVHAHGVAHLIDLTVSRPATLICAIAKCRGVRRCSGAFPILNFAISILHFPISIGSLTPFRSFAFSL